MSTGRKLGSALAASALSILLSCSATRQPAPGPTPGAPITDRPKWLKDGIVMVGNWEPLTFRLRKGGGLADELKQWNVEHSEETVKKLKALGVTLMIPNLHKGFGLKTEARDIEATRKLAEMLHRHGMRAGGYIGATMMYETFFLEEPEARNWTFPALIATERLVKEQPEVAAGAVRAIVKTQKALRANPQLAVKAAQRLFPAEEASFIALQIARDAPFYHPTITEEMVGHSARFAQEIGALKGDVRYEELVATQFAPLWQG